ncbi:UNVERIFIED_CONTAM: hypothetical protein FKN15_006096 [Acipenser sinensis]
MCTNTCHTTVSKAWGHPVRQQPGPHLTLRVTKNMTEGRYMKHALARLHPTESAAETVSNASVRDPLTLSQGTGVEEPEVKVKKDERLYGTGRQGNSELYLSIPALATEHQGCSVSLLSSTTTLEKPRTQELF